MRKKVENISRKMTRWIGSPASLIVHTLFFIAMLSLRFFGVSTGDVLLILTTIVSLEAIYLSIFIQMTVNEHAKELEEVSEDIEEIQEDVEGISEDVEDIQEDVADIQEDVEEITEDMGELQEDVEDIHEEMDIEEESNTENK